MEVSIPPQHISLSVSSQNSLKRPKINDTIKSGVKPPKRRRKINDRQLSDCSLDGQDDIYNCHLSPEIRDTVLKLKKIKDPFDEHLQQVVDDVFDHLEDQKGGDVDLAESALLLSGVTNVFSSQVKSLHDDVLAFAARLSGKPIPQKGRHKKKNCEGDLAAEGGDENSTPEDGSLEKNPATESTESKTSDNENPNADGVNGSQENIVSSETADQTNEDGNIQVDINGAPVSDSSTENTVNTDETCQENSLENNNNCDKPENGNDNNEQTVEANIEDLQKLETEILHEIPGRCTRRQSERLKNILNLEKANDRDYGKLKKRKFDDDPPDLISCHEEWKQIQASIEEKGDLNMDEILPPTLELQIGRKRKKVMINNNDEIEDNNCETCQRDVDSKDNLESCDPTPTAICDSPIGLTIPSCLNGQKYETLDHLSDDVQERFHALIQEMHKLPFDYGLMQQDMFVAYQQKFLQAVTLLSQNSVLVKKPKEGNLVSDIPEKPVVQLNDSQLSEETDQTISSIAELLNQVRLQAAEDYNKGKQSKTDAEVPVSQMIATLKRIICSRYKKWHVRTDGDKAVFKRIKEFEDKVKNVLKQEAEQGLFDVKKYEMEVMDATIRETQDNEGDELFCPVSPIPSHNGAESPRAEELRNWALNDNSRRSSIAGSIDGSSSWIRLFDIFSHMKRFDHSETCRHFYAILALLSHKNLSLNYDTLLSQESAKLITKFFKKYHNENMTSKYPVGAKIMTSRCPDIDRDEVLLAPIFTPESFHQVLEHDGYLSSSGYQSDSQASCSTSGITYIPAKTIEDAINEFVPDEGEQYTGELFKIRRRKY